jgi:16S rRNA processing protein RimM
VGLKGEVEVTLETDNPERFAVGSRFNDGLVIATSRVHNGRTIVSFEGITDRNGAEALRGTVLEIEMDEARALDDDEYWDHDLIGSTVVTLDGTVIGVVDDVVQQPTGSLLSVGKHFIPLVRDVVKSVEEERIVIDPIPGLLDDA